MFRCSYPNPIPNLTLLTLGMAAHCCCTSRYYVKRPAGSPENIVLEHVDFEGHLVVVGAPGTSKQSLVSLLAPFR
jgi:hypothetical protein